MARALVTGGTGFVGSHVVRALVAAGHTPRVLRRQTSRMDALEGLAGYGPVIGDVLDPASLDAAMDGCEWVFHVAAVSDYWRQDVGWLYKVNVDGTRHVLAAAKRAGVSRLVFTSSAAAVGFREDGFPADETVTFNQPPGAFPYAHSKFLAEIEVLKAIIGGLDCVIVNPAVITGPGDVYQGAGSLLIEMSRHTVPAIPPGGVTLIDVRDVAAAHLAAAERGRVAERYILGAVDLSHRAWLRLIADVIGVRPPWLPLPCWAMPVAGAVVDLVRGVGIALPADGTQIRYSGRRIYFNCEKAWTELGEPQIEIRQSLQDAYDWYQAHGMV
jgi:dihydroflavonol-4-reductase